MILDHIPERARVFIITTPSFYPHCFGSGYLNMINIISIPYWFEECIGKSQGKYILYGFLAQAMINAENLFFVKKYGQHFVHFLSTFKIVTKRFFNNNPGTFSIMANREFAEVLHNYGNKLWRNGHIKNDIEMYPILCFGF